jgi:hypothetical protein
MLLRAGVSFLVVGGFRRGFFHGAFFEDGVAMEKGNPDGRARD